MRSNGAPDSASCGQSAGTVRCSTLACGNSAIRALAVTTAAAAPSHESRASQRGASWAVSTPIEQPGSNALRYRDQGSMARLTAYLRRSYQRVVKAYGSVDSAYSASKCPDPRVVPLN